MGGMGYVWSFVQRFVLSRAGSSVFGFIAVLGLVWYAGPYVGLTGVRTRLVVMGALAGLACAVFLITRLVTRLRGKRFHSDLHQQMGTDRHAERQVEIDAIREKLAEAIKSLKGSKLGGFYKSSAALYALPWYMVIGPSAAGKSTVLRQSGLHFPYANAEDLSLKGVGGTRNCDWWFSDQAILLDTAGRYTTEEDDREEWFAFLDLLRKHRPRMPLNGVLLAISVADVLTADSEGVERHVKIVRGRISELMRRLRLVFPVYVVFTKCDLIQGFEAYFEDLGEQERNQVWGAYLWEDEDRDGPSGDHFESSVRRLYAKLCELRLRKLSMQRNLERKGALFDFPNQFDVASRTVAEFVDLLCRDNPYQETPSIAGIYFTSGTQEGTPLQRLIGNMRQAFGYATEGPREASQAAPKSYFIKNLFTDVIFQLQGAVQGSRRRIYMQRGLKSLALGACLTVLTGTFLLLSGSYAQNALLLRQGRVRADALRSALANPASTGAARYHRLAEIYAYYNRLRSYETEKPWRFSVGMYTGDRELPALRKLLLAGMGRLFWAHTLRSLEGELGDYAREWKTARKPVRVKIRSAYYGALKTYLSLTSDRGRLSASSAAHVLAPVWAKSLGLVPVNAKAGTTGSAVPRMAGLIAFYLREVSAKPGTWPSWTTRRDLIAQARHLLHTPLNAKRLYALIKARGLAKFRALGVDDLLTGQNRGVLIASGSVPGLYTAKAWYGFVRPQISKVVASASKGDWVLGERAGGPDSASDPGLSKQLRAGIRSAYFSDYADAWLNFLHTVRPASFRSLTDASAKLMMLGRTDGPISELMAATAANIDLYEHPLHVPSGKKARGGGDNGSVDAVPELDAALSSLREFANPANKKAVSGLVNQYLLVLSTIKNEVDRLSAAADVPRQAEHYAASLLGNAEADSGLYKGWVATNSILSGADVRTRRALGPLLETPLRATWRRILAAARTRVQQEWSSTVASVYGQQLRGRFPFRADGADVAVDDLADFFRPRDGVLWSFVDQNMSSFLAHSRHGWRERRWLGMGIGFSREFLRSLREARKITDSLFRHGGSEPKVVFYVYPEPGEGESEIRLTSNGQTYRYRNGPQEWQRFTWPGRKGRIGATVSGINALGTASAELDADGRWGLFHLLRKAKLVNRGGTVYSGEWDLKASGQARPIAVRFRIRADREVSIFQKGLLAGFRLPGQVFATRGGIGQRVAQSN